MAHNEKLLRQRAVSLWFTGLSGSGKTTIGQALEEQLRSMGFVVFGLDGDKFRTGLSKDLGFSDEDRHENLRRAAEVAKLFNDAGLIVVSTFISPFAQERARARQIIGKERFVEVFVDTPLEVCEQRDVKGLYKKARSGVIKKFTGISSPYEAPENPEIRVATQEYDVASSVEQIITYYQNKFL